MADHIHLFKPGASITCVAGADVVGGRVVKVTGAREVEHTTAGTEVVFGVAARDTAEGEDVLVLRGGVQKLVASAAIAAGARVQAAAAGKVATVSSTNPTFGTALTAATAADQLVEIALD